MGLLPLARREGLLTDLRADRGQFLRRDLAGELRRWPFSPFSKTTPALIHCQICEREISAVAASSIRLKMATAPRPRSHASM